MPRRSITVCTNLIFIFRSTIYACELEAHVKRCNETKTITTQQQLPFYSCDYCLCDDKSDNLQQASYEKGANHLSKMIAQMQQAEWDALVQKVEQLFLSCFGTSNVQSAIKTQIFPLETCAQLVKEGETQKEKHLVQQACLFGHLKECNMFDMNQYVYAEFGCGKSELSYRLCQVATMENAQLVETLQKKPNANAVPRFVGIDRSTFRKKCDGPIRTLLNNVHSVQRILIDIKDLNLNLVPALHAEPVVVISKHLCGIATDLTLRCLAMAQQTVDTRGLFICLCCHHCCTWKSYANQSFFTKNQFSQLDFERMSSMSSWAVSQLKEEKLIFNCTNAQREQFAYKCKRLIDYGRCELLKQTYKHVQLVYYVDASKSPENCMLIAIK